ncbi:hypothetical protein [Streptomyces carpinensis]|uniref:Uncharacterized protein n=1 Tax=Streptomyces carpinensis TaxID=66369 RepID=A0ABV1WF54_9ACTN|nr:hypothetical protein [Streptomyces carpinensis]
MTGESRAACKAVTELHREDLALTRQQILAHVIAAIGTAIRVEPDNQVVRPAQTDGPPPVAEARRCRNRSCRSVVDR